MATRAPEGPPPPPAVQRLRLRHARRERLRFSSHRDFQRALERALRRAEVPMAYSAGFSPHPRISYAGAAPTGAASEAEYVEIAVTARCLPAALRAALDSALPPGLDVLEVVEVPLHGAVPLTDLLEAGEWELVLPGVPVEAARRAVAALLAAPSAVVERVTTKGRRALDVRAAVLRLELVDPALARSGAGRAAASTSGAGGSPVRYSTWSSGTPHLPCDPTTSSPHSAGCATSRRRKRFARPGWRRGRSWRARQPWQIHWPPVEVPSASEPHRARSTQDAARPGRTPRLPSPPGDDEPPARAGAARRAA